MAVIKTMVRYQYEGKEFNDLSKVKKEVENSIGAIIDQFDLPSIRLTPKQRLHILEVISNNKKGLRALLNVTFEVEGDHFGQDYNKNILDL